MSHTDFDFENEVDFREKLVADLREKTKRSNAKKVRAYKNYAILKKNRDKIHRGSYAGTIKVNATPAIIIRSQADLIKERNETLASDVKRLKSRYASLLSDN